jgi:hypothetical protein
LDHASLAVLFRRIVLAGPPLLLGTGFNVGCMCPQQGDATETVVITDAIRAADAGSEATTDQLIARCEASSATCKALCERVEPWLDPTTIKSCQLTTSYGVLEVHAVYTGRCVGGRSPEGLAPPGFGGARDPLGAWLAYNAHLEAASIDAFEILAAELDAHGAPPELTRAARAATADERRHADVVGRLAARRGAAAPAVQVNRGPIRDLEAIARENAVEGCVRETYAALIASRQAYAATDPAIRAAMAGIARDETRHAALAWAVDSWSQALLPPAAGRRVREARHEAIEQLVNARLAELPRDSLTQAGLPEEEEEARLAGALGARLV